MRVLLVTQYFWPETFPVNLLADALKDTGCEITVLTGQPNYPEGKIFKGYSSLSVKKEQHNDLSVFRVPMITRGKSGSIRLFINYCSFAISASMVGPWLLRGKKFDIIIAVAQSPILAVIPAIILKRIKRLPLVTWVGDLWPESLRSTGHVSNSFILKMVGKLAGWVYNNSDLVLVQSETFRNPILELSRSAVVAYLPNPAKVVSAESDNCSSLVLDKGFNVVYAGNIGTVQSLEMIVAAAELLKDELHVRFVLVGSGSKSEWLKQVVEEKQLTNIQLPGRFPPLEIPAILKQADALLVSLVKDKTMSLTVPSKTQSYMAVGKPIIAALDGEGARVVTEAEAGIATPAEDARALATAVIFLRDAPAELKIKMGRNAQDYFAKHFESGAVGIKLASFLKETITVRDK